jgi:hypothetical protein
LMRPALAAGDFQRLAWSNCHWRRLARLIRDRQGLDHRD